MKPLAILSLAPLTACATSPANIAPAYVSPLSYESFSCDQLAIESQRLTGRIAEASGQQQQKVDADQAAMAVGLLVFFPAMFLVGNGPQAQELGRLKGEADALNQAAQRKCS